MSSYDVTRLQVNPLDAEMCLEIYIYGLVARLISRHWDGSYNLSSCKIFFSHQFGDHLYWHNGDMPVRVSAHRSLNYAKGVVRFQQTAQDLTIEDLASDLNMSRHNRDQPQVKDASRVTITKGGKKVQPGKFFLTFDAPTLPENIFLGYWRSRCVPALTYRMTVRTRNLPNAQTAMVHILLPVENAQHSSLRKQLLKSR